MTKNYEDMTYFQLKSECAKQGLDYKGNKAVLLKRLQGEEGVQEDLLAEEEIVEAPQKEEKVEPIIIQPTQEEIQRVLMPDQVRMMTNKRDIRQYAAHLDTERLAKLENRLNEIAAGKGTFTFDINYNEGWATVKFMGGAGGPETMTLITSDEEIVKNARFYFSRRLAKGGNGQVGRM